MGPRVLARAFYTLMLISFLSACGGGGDSTIIGGNPDVAGGNTTTDTPTTTAAVPQLTLSLKAVDGTTDISEVNGAERGRVLAEVRDDVDGELLSGVVVRFSSTLGEISPASGTALTNALGIAEVGLTAGSSAGAGTVTATATVTVTNSGVDTDVAVSSNRVNFQTDGLASGDVNLPFTVTLSVTSNTISNLNPVTATALVAGTDGAPVPDSVVEFTMTLGETNPASGSTITDANGLATIQALSTSTVGNGVLTAALVVGTDRIDSNSINYITTFDPPKLALSLIDQATGLAVNSISRDAVLQVQASFLDGAGAPVSDAVVNFSSDLGALSDTSSLTNALGVATNLLTAGNIAGAGTVSASATFDGVAISSDKTFSTDGQQNQPFTGSVQLVMTPAAISSRTPGVATLTVLEENGDPVIGAIVEFSTTTRNLEPSSGSVSTDGLGRANVNIIASGTTGKGVLSAQVTIDNEVVTATPVNFIVEELTFGVVLSDSILDGNEIAVATATLTDLDGVAIENIVVTFESVQGLVSRFENALTNASGIAVANILGSGIAGEGTVTATVSVNGVQVSDIAVFQGTDVNPELALVLSDISLTEGVSSTVTATVTDVDGAGIADVLVSFESSLGTLGTSTALTNASGVALT